jgi:hypothetical protein
MTALLVTKHAGIRLAQRSIQDADLIAIIGTEVADGYLVRDRDVEVVEHQLKKLIERIRRLRGKRLVVIEGRIVTGYHATSRQERRLLEDAEERELTLSAEELDR